MSDPFKNEAFPRGALIAVAALLAFTLALVVLAQHLGGKPDTAPSAAVSSRDLQFFDLEGGTVEIRDADEGVTLAILDPGTENFIRGVLRGLVRERRAAGGAVKAPFRLSRHANGQLTLEDTATGRVVYLRAFGRTNAGAFSRLLADQSQPS